MFLRLPIAIKDSSATIIKQKNLDFVRWVILIAVKSDSNLRNYVSAVANVVYLKS